MTALKIKKKLIYNLSPNSYLFGPYDKKHNGNAYKRCAGGWYSDLRINILAGWPSSWPS